MPTATGFAGSNVGAEGYSLLESSTLLESSRKKAEADGSASMKSDRWPLWVLRPKAQVDTRVLLGSGLDGDINGPVMVLLQKKRRHPPKLRAEVK